MADVERAKLSPTQMSIAAIVIAVLTGGSGLGINMASNKEVIAELKTLTLTMVEVKGAIKSNDERSARLEVKVEKHDEQIEKLRTETNEKLHAEISELRQAVRLLEARVK